MAVQARHHLSHAFPFTDDATMMFPDEFAARCGAPAAAGMVADTTMLRAFPRSDLTCGNLYGGFEFEPRKRARVADGFFVDDRREALHPVPAVDGTRASTSGRTPDVSASVSDRLLLSRLCNHDAEIDALVWLESERMRLGLEDARRRHARALLSVAARAASGRLRAAEAELDRAVRRGAELEDRLRQVAAECQAWMGVARSHEAVAAGLRATLDQLLLGRGQSSPCDVVGEGDAEDAQSCCFDGAASRSGAAACKVCGCAEACVLLLPCRHLCLCKACDAAVDACPVCAADRNGSLVVLFS